MAITEERKEAGASERLYELQVRVASCERRTVAEAKQFAASDVENAGRRIRLADCPIISTSLKGDGEPVRGDEIEVTIYEFESDQVIGSFHNLGDLYLSLPPAAFAEFWSGCAAADGVPRTILILFKYEVEAECFRVTRVDLVEFMAPAVDYNPKNHQPGWLPGRPHPVVAEWREISARLIGSWKGFLYLVCFLLGIGLVTQMLGAVWRFIQH